MSMYHRGVATASISRPELSRIRGCCQQLATTLPVSQAERLATLFKAFADPTRVQMLHMLKAASEPICVCDFTAAFDLGQPTVSHHLAKLREAGLVTSSKRGIWTFHSIAPRLIPVAQALLDLVP